MKRSNHSVELQINANPDTVWEIVGSGKDVDKWLAPITSCRVDGNKRYCATADGSFEEDILDIDQVNKIFSYFIPKQHLLPVKDIEGKMQVKTIDEHTSAITWSWNYLVEETDDHQVREALNGLGQMGIKGIEAFANNLVS
ncbi:SRPBCC family protein [Winogradskyella flava]|uniref:SRPBCC family protein n=1 Tax=Winogradskyella flava TaxID=1884876 RepID=A0A842IUX1_9FLAO|nr:SRPBCC family protein [Winogradskyella flava]MBC2845714.1 SRPBCC family protein [Winogradskyella flava]